MDDPQEDLEFGSWDEFAAYVFNSDSTGWVFRGQSSFDWPLQSKICRILRSFPKTAWKDREDYAIGRFKARAHLFLTVLPSDDDALGWLALMQHYGAPTRLLDWTDSPFVAAWFAYCEPDRESDGAIYLLNAAACRSRLGTKLPYGRDHLGVTRLMTYADGRLAEATYPGEDYDHRAEENALLRWAIREQVPLPVPLLPLTPDRRMAGQQSVFTLDATFDGIPFPLRDLVPTVVENDGEWKLERTPLPLLSRIRMPHAWRREALDALALMNITAESLFPGLDGLGRDIGLSLQCDMRLRSQDVFDQRMNPRRETHSPDPPPATDPEVEQDNQDEEH